SEMVHLLISAKVQGLAGCWQDPIELSSLHYLERQRVTGAGGFASPFRYTVAKLMTLDPPRVVHLTSFAEEEQTRPALRYWLSRPPAERIAAVEYLRRQVDGDSTRFRRIQRFLYCP